MRIRKNFFATINGLFQLGVLAIMLAFGQRMNAQIMYVPENDGNTVDAYNISTGTAVNVFSITGVTQPVGVAVSGNNLFVNYSGTGGNSNIGEYNATTGALISGTFIQVTGPAQAMVVSGTNLYVVYDDLGSAAVGVYDVTTGAQIQTLFPTIDTANGIAISGTDMYIAGSTGGNGTVGVFNASTGATINASLISIPTNYLNGIAISGNNLYVSEMIYPGVVVKYTTAGVLVSGSFTPGEDPFGLAISGNNLFVSNDFGGPPDTVSEFNLTSGTTINANFLSGLQYPQYLAIATGSVAQIVAPANGSTLTSSSGTFTWSQGTLVTKYWLAVGNSPKGTDIYSSLVTGESQTVPLPDDGRRLYVTLYSYINGKWQYTSYIYTAFTGAGPLRGQLQTPVNGTTFTSTSGTFTWSTTPGDDDYYLTIGSTPHGEDVFKSQEAGVAAVTAKLPGDGRPLYATFYVLNFGKWYSDSGTYTAVDFKAIMTSPTGGSTLGSGNVTFNWTPGTGVSKLWLTAGSTPGAADLYSAQVNGTSQAVTLPTDGRRIYVNLWSQQSTGWRANSYTYYAFTSGTDPKAALTSPANGSTFSPGNVTFNWSPGTNVTEIWLTIGSKPAGEDIYSAAATGLTTQTLAVPTDGRPLYVSLWSLINGVWGSNQYIYTAASVTTPNGLITAPTNGTILSSGPLALLWTAGTSATEYWLAVGSSPGATNLYSASQGNNLSQTVSVPVDGGRLYVTLWSLIGGAWKADYYFYDTTQ